MGVREDTVALLRAGLPPSQICKHLGVTLKTTIGYLEQMIGRGGLRRSDVFYSLSPEVRNALMAVSGDGKSSKPAAVWARLDRAELTNVWPAQDLAEGDILVYYSFGDARAVMGDMYEDLRQIETHLHGIIRYVLQQHLGQGDSNWWAKGVPLKVRQACQSRREEELETCERHAYHFTDVTHLAVILEKNWTYFDVYMRKVNKDSGFKKKLLNHLHEMNRIRRRVMHPVRFDPPTETDFQLTRELRAVTSRLIDLLYQENLRDTTQPASAEGG